MYGQSTVAGRFNGAFDAPMLPFWLTTIRPPLLRAPFLRWPRIRPWAVVLYTLITVGATNLRRRPQPPLRLLPVRLTISGCRTDFEFVQLIPLFIGAIPLRDGSQFANPTARINRFWIIHVDIMNYTTALIQYSEEIKHAEKFKTIYLAPLSAL